MKRSKTAAAFARLSYYRLDHDLTWQTLARRIGISRLAITPAATGEKSR